jgi:crossover junction endodeoxyribonuclease RusA
VTNPACRIVISVSLPLRTRSTLNVREHWRKRAKRAQEERAVVRMRLAGVRGWPPPLPVTVTFTRVGPRALDDDNLAGSFKAVRDGAADALGVDDGSDEVQWLYVQEKGAYEVRVKVESKST